MLLVCIVVAVVAAVGMLRRHVVVGAVGLKVAVAAAVGRMTWTWPWPAVDETVAPSAHDAVLLWYLLAVVDTTVAVAADVAVAAVVVGRRCTRPGWPLRPAGSDEGPGPAFFAFVV